MKLSSDQPRRIEALCEGYGTCSLRMFGSAAEGRGRDDGHVDRLLDFMPGHAPSAFELQLRSLCPTQAAA